MERLKVMWMVVNVKPNLILEKKRGYSLTKYQCEYIGYILINKDFLSNAIPELLHTRECLTRLD